MIFEAKTFNFDGVSSEVFGIKLCTTRDSGVLNQRGIVGERKIDIISQDFENVLFLENPTQPTTVTLEFVAVDRITNDPKIWTDAMLSNAETWLFKNNFCPFISSDNPDDIYFLKGIRFSKKLNIINQGIIEIKFQLYSNYPFKKRFLFLDTNSSTDNIFKINVDCMEDEQVYPKLKVTPYDTNTLKIKNNSLETIYEFEITENVVGEEIIIENKTFLVYDKDRNNQFSRVNRNWLYFIKGINDIEIVGNCKVEIEYITGGKHYDK